MSDTLLATAIQELRCEILQLKDMLRSRDRTPDDILTTQEAAEYLRVAPNRIRSFVRVGLRTIAIGKGFTFRRGDLDEWIKNFSEPRIETWRGPRKAQRARLAVPTRVSLASRDTATAGRAQELAGG